MLEVHKKVKTVRGEPSYRRGAEPGKGAERLEPSGNVNKLVRVNGSSAGVTGIEGAEEIRKFAAAALADNEPIGSHPKRRTNQLSHADPTGTLKVGLPLLERNKLGLPAAQLGNLLDRDDALGVGDFSEQRGEQRALASTGGSRNQHALALRHSRAELIELLGAHHAQGGELIETARGRTCNSD